MCKKLNIEIYVHCRICIFDDKVDIKACMYIVKLKCARKIKLKIYVYCRICIIDYKVDYCRICIFEDKDDIKASGITGTCTFKPFHICMCIGQ